MIQGRELGVVDAQGSMAEAKKSDGARQDGEEDRQLTSYRRIKALLRGCAVSIVPPVSWWIR